MNLYYISALSSERLIRKLFLNGDHNINFALQKFSRLLAKGFVENGVKTTVFSMRPVSHKTNHKIIWGKKQEAENGISYHYIPFINILYLRQFCIFINTFLSFFFIYFTKKGHNVYVYDVLCVSGCLGGLLANKIRKETCVGIVTDMPGTMVGNGIKNSFFSRIITKIRLSYISSFDKYVFLTEQMNDVINIHHRPYIVMEGLVDANMKPTSQEKGKKETRSILYAGALYERYGLRMLIEAFKRLPHHDIQLILYGNGPMAKDLKSEKDTRIDYRGVALNEEIIKAEKEATLLVNPRPTHEDFTKYSFPSKNMEYMLSGTALLTTKLPGMPKDYYPYIYIFDEETTDGYARKINEIISLPIEELKETGIKGQQFVLKYKNNIIQANRIIDLISR